MFIKVTTKNHTVYINSRNILCFFKESDGITRICETGSEDTYWQVSESPVEILKQLTTTRVK